MSYRDFIVLRKELLLCVTINIIPAQVFLDHFQVVLYIPSFTHFCCDLSEKSLVNRKSCFSWTCMKSSQINVRSFYQQSLPVVHHFKALKFDQTFHWCSVDVASSIKSQCKTAALRLQRNLLSLSFAQLAINQVLPYFLLIHWNGTT